MSNAITTPHPGKLKRTFSAARISETILEHNFVLIFVALIVIASLLSPNFLTVQNVANLFQQATIVGITAVGMTFVILTANIDLSVGSMVAFGGVLVAVIMRLGVPPELAAIGTVLAGGIIGLAMGAISA
jgi:ribose transport system permease protein